MASSTRGRRVARNAEASLLMASLLTWGLAIGLAQAKTRSASDASREAETPLVRGGDRGRTARKLLTWPQLGDDPFEEAQRLSPPVFPGFLGEGFDAGERWSCDGGEGCGGTGYDAALALRGSAVPPPWDSTACQRSWGVSSLGEAVDPSGYVIFVNSREHLEGSMHLVADALFVARSLNRTLVEFPVEDSRVARAGAELAMGVYWDMTQLCSLHRILDFRAFRSLVERGGLRSEDFVTIGNANGRERPMRGLRDARDAVEYFDEYKGYKVLVMEGARESGIRRDSAIFMRPNPFYLGIIHGLLRLEDWSGANYMAVVWETEGSTGDLTKCYQEIRAEVEEQRKKAGLERHQVIFDTDLHRVAPRALPISHRGERSGNHVLPLIRQDYPRALDNEVYSRVEQIEDSGVRALIMGLTAASAKVLLSTSLNEPGARYTWGANRCQQPHSSYASLVSQWRSDVSNEKPETLVRLFPFESIAPRIPTEVYVAAALFSLALLGFVLRLRCRQAEPADYSRLSATEFAGA